MEQNGLLLHIAPFSLVFILDSSGSSNQSALSFPLRGITIGLGQERKGELTALKSLETFIGPVYLCVTAQLLNIYLASGHIWLSLCLLGDGL